MTKTLFTQTHDHFRKVLIEAREKRGLTQTDVAKKLGRPQSFVSKYENGERRLDVVEFLEVSDALSINPSRIIGQLLRHRSASQKCGRRKLLYLGLGKAILLCLSPALRT